MSDDFTVAPGLLIAMPSLDEPEFARSVVMLCAHNAEGGFGLIVNRPAQLEMAAICAEAGVEWQGDEDATAFSGGPVDLRRGWLLHGDDLSFTETQQIGPGLSLSTSQEALAAYSRAPHLRHRLLLGYAGWGPGQLDEEIATGAWMTAPLDSEIIFRLPPERMWEASMRSLGIELAHLVETEVSLH